MRSTAASQQAAGPPQQDTCGRNWYKFNGFEPVNFGTSGITAAPVTAADQQDAIADQGSGVAQKLCISGTSGDLYDINITFIDQNNA